MISNLLFLIWRKYGLMPNKYLAKSFSLFQSRKVVQRKFKLVYTFFQSIFILSCFNSLHMTFFGPLGFFGGLNRWMYHQKTIHEFSLVYVMTKYFLSAIPLCAQYSRLGVVLWRLLYYNPTLLYYNVSHNMYFQSI